MIIMMVIISYYDVSEFNFILPKQGNCKSKWDHKTGPVFGSWMQSKWS